ncbi:hypothetical protein GQX74_013096 [Glossina fuscipes]|nr:hypothetical protein GQX74_013096 [Glossina fuscipes]
MKVFDDCTLRLVRCWFWIIITWLISLCGFTDIISPVSSQKLLWKRMKDKLGKETRARATVKAGGEESWLETRFSHQIKEKCIASPIVNSNASPIVNNFPIGE